ncbi:hypothetical protein D1007_01351 [Hordeum vulgare]|nr:hypothetical protein D1007_01351 [Hordeum vulgare]
MAATPHSVTTLDDVEGLLRYSTGKGAEVPCCQLEEDAAINAAVKVKAMVDSGAVRLVNPWILANKLHFKAAVQEWVDEMIDRLPFSPREMQALDESIAMLKNRLQTPYAVAYPGSMGNKRPHEAGLQVARQWAGCKGGRPRINATSVERGHCKGGQRRWKANGLRSTPSMLQWAGWGVAKTSYDGGWIRAAASSEVSCDDHGRHCCEL